MSMIIHIIFNEYGQAIPRFENCACDCKNNYIVCNIITLLYAIGNITKYNYSTTSSSIPVN